MPAAISKVSKQVYTRTEAGGNRLTRGCFDLENREPTKGFEPPTHALRKHCSTPELRRRVAPQRWRRRPRSISTGADRVELGSGDQAVDVGVGGGFAGALI